MICSKGALLTALPPRATFEQVYRDGVDVAVVGSAQPAGKAEAAPASGRLADDGVRQAADAFGSGCEFP
jgi:hypothetical protein